MPELKKPIRRWGSLKQVQAWYHEEKNVRQSQKLNAIRLLMEGKSQNEVAEVIGMCVATIRGWTAKWNKAGKEGLKALHKGRSSKVTDDIKLDIEEVIEIKREIDGRTITGYLIQGYVKKNTSSK